MTRRWAILGMLTAASAALAVAACSSSSSGGGATSNDGGPDSTTGSDDAGDSAAAPETGTAHEGGADATPEAAAAACTVFDASGVDEAAVAAGFDQVWKVYKCWSCHQKASQVVSDAGVGIVLSGNNDGLGDSGMIFPPNLTNDPTGLGCWTTPQIEQAILFGKDPEGGTLCPPMSKLGLALQLPNDGGPKPGTPMDAGTLAEVIAYLRSLPPVSNTVNDTTCAMPEAGTAADAGDAATE